MLENDGPQGESELNVPYDEDELVLELAAHFGNRDEKRQKHGDGVEMQLVVFGLEPDGRELPVLIELAPRVHSRDFHW